MCSLFPLQQPEVVLPVAGVFHVAGEIQLLARVSGQQHAQDRVGEGHVVRVLLVVHQEAQGVFLSALQPADVRQELPDMAPPVVLVHHLHSGILQDLPILLLLRRGVADAVLLVADLLRGIHSQLPKHLLDAADDLVVLLLVDAELLAGIKLLHGGHDLLLRLLDLLLDLAHLALI